MDNKNVVVTTRVPEELRRELRLILMKKGITVQDFLADTIAKYVRAEIAAAKGEQPQ